MRHSVTPNPSFKNGSQEVVKLEKFRSQQIFSELDPTPQLAQT